MGLETVIESIEKIAGDIGVPAWGIVIRQEHRELCRHTEGFADHKGVTPFTDRHVCWLYSLTKLATCASAMRLVELGKLRLEDKVADYLPAFAKPQVLENGVLRPAKRELTVLDLLTMRGGYDYDGSILEELAKTETGNDVIINAIAGKPLLFDPGEQFQYSLCHDVLGGVIAAASGMPFRDWMRVALFEPLGMTETAFIASYRERSPFCAQYISDNGHIVPDAMENHFVFTPEYCSGGAGLSTTMRDYDKLIDALANEGVGANGARILNADTIRLMAQNQLTPQQTQAFGQWRPGYGYGLGVRTRLQDRAQNPGGFVEFGWDGAAGAYALADITNHISILYMQHVRNCGRAYDELHPAIRDAVYQALGL